MDPTCGVSCRNLSIGLWGSAALSWAAVPGAALPLCSWEQTEASFLAAVALSPWMLLRLSGVLGLLHERPNVIDPFCSPCKRQRFPEKLPALCLVYKHLCNSTSDTAPWCFVLPRTVLPRELERKETISCWGFGSPAHAISTPSAHWAPAPVCWSPGVSVRLLRSFRCMPRKCHLSIFQGRLQSPGASHAAQHSCVCAPQQPLSPAHHSHTSAFETLFVLSSMFLWGFNVIAGFGKIFSHCTKKWYASALGKRVPAGLVYKEWPETS